ncbi:MAG: RNA pseudouridine synthase [Rhodospirillales bacterium RIFCSPLOWO2_12_FULL_67_15]|nr:MAG: RNA pseudouridine synthase [Rhodospirillales bacterium RIFCSPLOWO2_12_FULL_67_15]
MTETIRSRTYTVTIPAGKAGFRLDRALADQLSDISRTRVRALIEDGHVRTQAGGRVRAKALVRAGESYVVVVPAARPAVPEAQAMDLHILHEDDDLIVLEKPAGLVVHPAPGNPDRTLVNALLAHCGGKLSGIGGVARPGIVHRLDKDTSGLMVVAKTDRAHHALAAQLEARTLTRVYRALVWGVPSKREGTIEGNIGRSRADRKKMAIVKRGGKPALTRYKVVKVLAGAISLVECRLATGRTHQIRVHMAGLGHPIVGDPNYGGAATARRLAALPRALAAKIGSLHGQALHARSLAFAHPADGRTMSFSSNKLCKFNDLME